jgi:acyl-CoA synthetase (AMP-forming)/AMP-acid ligase II
MESVLIGHPDVAEVCVITVPDGADGKRPRAFVVLRADAAERVDALHAYCQEHFPEMTPPQDVEVLPELPRGPMGTVLRRKLVERVLAGN